MLGGGRSRDPRFWKGEGMASDGKTPEKDTPARPIVVENDEQGTNDSSGKEKAPEPAKPIVEENKETRGS